MAVDERLEDIAQQIAETISDGVSHGVQAGAQRQRQRITEIWIDEDVTTEEKKVIFQILYGQNPEGQVEDQGAVTLEEVLVMMIECGIDEYKLARPQHIPA